MKRLVRAFFTTSSLSVGTLFSFCDHKLCWISPCNSL